MNNIITNGHAGEYYLLGVFFFYFSDVIHDSPTMLLNYQYLYWSLTIFTEHNRCNNTYYIYNIIT